MLSFKGFNVVRGEKQCFKIAELDLKPGIYLLIAPNGSGKSSFFMILSGLLKSQKGVQFNGSRLRASDVLYLSEYLNSPKYVLPKEWIEYLSGVKFDPSNPFLSKFRLSPLLSRFMGRMSQGERSKCNWIASDQAERPIILMDEPLRGLDFQAVSVAREVLEKWKKTGGRWIWIVTHQIADLVDLADRSFLIHQKQLIEWKPENTNNYIELRRELSHYFPLEAKSDATHLMT